MKAAIYIDRRGWTLAGVCQDQMSGAKAQRPGLDGLMAGARLHKCDAVIVWKPGRFGRSHINCVAGIQKPTAAQSDAAEMRKMARLDAQSPHRPRLVKSGSTSGPQPERGSVSPHAGKAGIGRVP